MSFSVIESDTPLDYDINELKSELATCEKRWLISYYMQQIDLLEGLKVCHNDKSRSPIKIDIPAEFDKELDKRIGQFGLESESTLIHIGPDGSNFLVSKGLIVSDSELALFKLTIPCWLGPEMVVTKYLI